MAYSIHMNFSTYTKPKKEHKQGYILGNIANLTSTVKKYV